MKPFLLAIAFLMAFAAPVMAERGAGSDLQKQGGFGLETERKDVDRPGGDRCPSHCNYYSFGDLGRLYCTRVCGQTF